jgi:hypothetical protein
VEYGSQAWNAGQEAFWRTLNVMVRSIFNMRIWNIFMNVQTDLERMEK